MTVDSSSSLHINCSLVETLLINFIQDGLKKFGFKKAILGLSGGIDSAVVAALLAHAIDPRQVIAVKMPYRTSSPSSLADADAVIRQYKISSATVDISDQVDPYFKQAQTLSIISEKQTHPVKALTPLRQGNKMARERMTVLYDLSMAEQALVIGTSNKTELLIGYGTQFGDMASAMNPIGDLYKTQIFQLAKHLKVPASVLDKPPSADLWPDQTDEKEMGISYDQLDQILYHMVDRRYAFEDLVEMGFTTDLIQTISQKVQRSQYKRRAPIIARISERTIESDFLYPRDWGA